MEFRRGFFCGFRDRGGKSAGEAAARRNLVAEVGAPGRRELRNERGGGGKPRLVLSSTVTVVLSKIRIAEVEAV
jgi:hypothetical protein